jgi:hypothetical protein
LTDLSEYGEFANNILDEFGNHRNSKLLDEGIFVFPFSSSQILKAVADSLGLSDAVLRHKNLIVADYLASSDLMKGNKEPLILTDSITLADLATVLVGSLVKSVMDAIGLSDSTLVNKPSVVADAVSLIDQAFRNKPAVSVVDIVGAVEVVLASKLLALTDSVSLEDLFRVLKSLSVSDAFSLVDAMATPERFLSAIDRLGLSDSAAVSKVLVVSDMVSVVEVVEVGMGGAQKTKMFLLLGDLAIQLTG